MRIERLEPRHDAEYRRFLDGLGATPSGAMVLGYHYPENRDMLRRVLGPGSEPCSFGAWSEAGELLAALPGMLHRSQGRSCYNSLPFFGPNAGVLAAAHEPVLYAELAAALTRAAVERARSEGALSAVFYSAFNPGRRALPNPELDSLRPVVIARTTLFTALTAEGTKWPQDIRYDIRKAEKAGVAVEPAIRAEDLDAVYALYRRNCEDNGTPLKPRECLESLLRAGPERAAAYSARLDGKLIAALLVLKGPRTASYYLPCSDPEHRGLQAGTLLADRACRDAMSAGLEYWNWEGSPGRDSGVYKFKRKWNAEEIPYEISVVRLAETAALRELGSRGLAEAFPFYFVYPYSELA